jgi:transmembrane sensor
VESWSEGDESLRLRLVAGERALLSDSAVVHHESDRASAVDRSLAWRSGMIDLNGTSLSEAADEFNRYNQRQIIIADPAVADEQFDGLFRINDPQGFAQAVKASLNVGVDESDSRVIRLIKIKS